MNNPISNDIFDTRDLIEYEQYLKDELLSAFNDMFDEEEDDLERLKDSEQFTDEFSNELKEHEEIKEFCKELESYAPDFYHGETVIHEDYFNEYAEELVKDCGYISGDVPSWIVIDWEETADNVKQDYTSIDFNGSTYYIR